MVNNHYETELHPSESMQSIKKAKPRLFGKLFKYEMIAYMRSLIPIWIVLLGTAVLNRIVQIFEVDSTVYNIIFGSSVFVYVIGIILTFVMTFINTITRFYRNLFTSEGYLSFTLPVSTAQHIWVKLLSALTVNIINLIAIILSVAIITIGDVGVEILKAAAYMIKSLIPYMNVHACFYIAEFLLMLLTALICGILLFYTCIAIGQLSKKNRVACAVGVYFIYYVISQIIGTILIVVITLLSQTEIANKISVFVTQNPYTAIHIGFGAFLAIYLFLSFVFYIVTYKIIDRKLNLE